MREAIPPLLQFAFMAWCSVKSIGTTLPFTLPFIANKIIIDESLPHTSQILNLLDFVILTVLRGAA
jgi:hypothetical protein